MFDIVKGVIRNKAGPLERESDVVILCLNLRYFKKFRENTERC